MATSSIDHNFVVKDKKNVQQLVEALSAPKAESVKPIKSISGKDAVTLLMSKWKNGK